ncbi:helix-turn-helix domain-containing protein [Arthrobacter sp. ISL-28]|uniref:helix-turn-helix domain-containing protein n=1 Tax=Arthrobacter sp. ISL-28 TaxID=2819108 RepID=UPI00288B2FBF|nr:helix-turn-helix domain-containing protein [Arthrobacter sp. ISL-28]
MTPSDATAPAQGTPPSRPDQSTCPGSTSRRCESTPAIRFSTLAAICEALDCQVGDLFVYDPAWEWLPRESRRFRLPSDPDARVEGQLRPAVFGQNETPPLWLVADKDGVPHLCTPRDLNPEPID